jgi:hypothetical protein
MMPNEDEHQKQLMNVDTGRRTLANVGEHGIVRDSS